MPRKFALTLVLLAALFSSALACYPGNPSADICPSQCKACYVTYVCKREPGGARGYCVSGWGCRALECGKRGASGAGGAPLTFAPGGASHPPARQQQAPAAPGSYSAPAHAMREPTLNKAYPFTKESEVVPRV